jgi:hypothetical protein
MPVRSSTLFAILVASGRGHQLKVVDHYQIYSGALCRNATLVSNAPETASQ